MEKEELGTKEIEKCIEIASKNIALGLLIAKDGVNEADMVHLPAAFENLKELVAFVASKPQVAAEIKDLDALEGLSILKKCYESYKEIKG